MAYLEAISHHGKPREEEMATQREMLLSIVDKAREDKDFFHALVFDPEKALATLEGLDETTKEKLRVISPNTFFVPQLVRSLGVKLQECDPTCSVSCGDTCGSISCKVTCGPFAKSCKDTCGASCGSTLAVQF
jgi:hypothetical protein